MSLHRVTLLERRLRLTRRTRRLFHRKYVATIDAIKHEAGPDMNHLPDLITVSVSSMRIMIAYVDG
jgi:hypothetical protein